MKKAMKVLLVVACAALLVVGSVFGTLAYLTDTEEVVNTFTVGSVQIKLDEATIDPETGKAVENADRVQKNEGIKLIPGRVVDKDPTVTVIGGSEECYVRVRMSVTWQNAANGLFEDQEYADWFNFGQNWIAKGLISDVDNGDGTYTETFEFWYNGAVAKAAADTELQPLFTEITIPGELTNEQVAAINNSTVTVVAHAIQAEGFADAEAAWAAFDAQGTP